MKIVIFGLGTVALADALALGRNNDVTLTGPVPDRVDAINAGIYGLPDRCLDAYLRDHQVMVRATLDSRTALNGAQMVFISAPLSIDPDTGSLRLIELESRIELAAHMLPHVPIVIRSAVPIGFTEGMRQRLNGAKLVYAPEFSRDGSELEDILRPAFVIVGDKGNLGAQVGRVLRSAALAHNIPVRQMPPTKAEALRHLSVLYQIADIAPGQRPTQNASHAPRPLNLAQPFARDRVQITPDLDQSHAARITVLADHILRHGGRQIGIYSTDAALTGNSPLMRLKAALNAFGLTTHLHLRSGAEDLETFKNTCDFVFAKRVTNDLMDIRDKVFTHGHFTAA